MLLRVHCDLYDLSRCIYDQRVPIYGFSSMSHFYVFSYIMYGIHKMMFFSMRFPSGSILFKSQMDGVRVVY